MVIPIDLSAGSVDLPSTDNPIPYPFKDAVDLSDFTKWEGVNKYQSFIYYASAIIS